MNYNSASDTPFVDLLNKIDASMFIHYEVIAKQCISELLTLIMKVNSNVEDLA